MTPGERVARQAAKYLGVSEVPPGSNRGPDVDRWQRPWGIQDAFALMLVGALVWLIVT